MKNAVKLCEAQFFAEAGCESAGDALSANSISAPVPRHPECASHTDVVQKFKLGWGGRRVGAGRPRKQADEILAKARLAAADMRLSGAAAPGARWYCIQSRPHMEIFSLDRVTERGFVAFMPRLKRQLPDKSIVVRSLFGTCYFVRFDFFVDPWRDLWRAPGIRRIFGPSPELPTPLPAQEVMILHGWIKTAIAEGVAKSEMFEDLPEIDLNQRVRIIGEGPLADLEGLCRLSAGGRVKILTDLLGSLVDVPRHMVELLEA